ncbi:dienelactone hydrolase family protein [Rhodospirillaceae bacterium SYSU D60014]|uniref:dienelactone hydrolase family protein n=1 Tax=Virgifigura deserti TaxID=2268457 RepID=UPI000E672C3B
MSCLWVFGLLALALLAAPARAASPAGDVPRTWDGASAFVRIEDEDYRWVVIGGLARAAYMGRILKSLTAAEPRGVIIHLHDCGDPGRQLDLRSQARFMASLGYVVFVPDSQRRKNRPITCDLERRLRFADAPVRAVQEMREQELEYALARVLAFPWVDPEQIFISGYGEGGDAVLDYAPDTTRPAIRGRIAIGATCRLGVSLRDTTPTLILISRNDRWHRHSGWPTAGGLCRHRSGGSRYVEIFEPDGTLHDALIYGESRVALWNFLVRASF